VGGVICKITFANHVSHLPWILQITPSTSHELSLDQDRVTQIEVSIVCMKRSVSTRYVPFFDNSGSGTFSHITKPR
jgi:hypothetical protein